MAESRRVQLTTLSQDGPPPSAGSTSLHQCPSGAPQGEEKRSDPDTVRLVLTLIEPDERSFPEFSYNQLIDVKINQSKAKVPLSRLEEEEKRESDEVAAIARKFEEKYGDKPKKKKDRIQDLIDIGYGYDEEDSFIDNSEAYDEFVPASITTKFGGFYVNSGMLQFRQTSDTETDDVTAEEKTLDLTKKRKLSGGQDKPKKKKCGAGEEKKNNMDPKLRTLSKTRPDKEMKVRRKKRAAKTLSVTSMLKKFQKEKERERQKMEKAHQRASRIMGATTFPVFPADAAGGGGSGQTDPLLTLIGSTNDHALIQAASTLDFDIDLDSLLDVSEETSSQKSLPQPAAETQRIQIKTDDHISDAKAQTSNTNSQLKPHPEQIQLLSEVSSASAHQCVPLPEGLPPGLEESIRKLTVAAKTSEGESKLKFFNPDINSILLDIELQCREQGGQLRSKVYTHLSSFLPCSRDTLLKRVKKLAITHVEPPAVEDPMQKLKETIGRSMPEQIACFHENCQAYEQTKTAKATEEDNVEEKAGKRGGPRKFFKWNEDVRECLAHVFKEKIDKYKKERKEGQEMEDYLKTFIDNEVKPLWPKGWMQSSVLLRESKKMLGAFMSLPVKKAKSDKRQSSMNGASTLPDGCGSFQGAPSLSGELSRGTEQVFTEDFNISSSVPPGVVQNDGVASRKDAVKVLDLDVGFASPTDSDGPVVNATSAPTHSLLDILADQALAREQPFVLSQELLAEAVAKYRHAVQHWSFSVDSKSSPVVPPPPQSSPVSFPVSRARPVALPRLLLAGDARHVDADGVQIISDDDDDIIIQ
ncbi:ubinuclein-1 [Stegastes partitus]|uniref:Ubinuclein-1 n=1 Tax=Stegastes partitus TaxID=144197 RepID=A0A9Y4NQ22_9TELE|nr:PREDICTED: ubinuclein-1 [Stegastes partitus]